MSDQEWTFGVKPGQLDRLLALGQEPTLASNDLIELPGGRVGRYRLLRVLGEGGMGVVYLAEQTEPVKREVALKVIKPGMDSKRVIARFEAEQQALALMEHPHVARVYDAGLAPSGRPYFVMEYVRGIPITAHCDKYKLTIEERLRLFLHVCEAIQHAHQKGIIHRDLKPSNILVALQDEETICKVIDFGVARATSRPLTERTLYTEQGQLIGTPEYMSPEQADLDNQDIDTRTDIYSLGVVLYELLAGVLPFDPKTLREGGIDHIRRVICEEDPKTPSTRLSRTSVEESAESARRRRTDLRTLQRKLRGDLDWITLRAMEKDRMRRYATVDALAADIRNYLSHQPVSAAPPAFLYRAGKFARRHRQALTALVLLALAIGGGLLAASMYFRAAREHTYVESLEHRRSLDQARMLLGNGRHTEALAKIDPLLNSPYVGRQARLAHAQVRLEQRDFATAITELEALVDPPSVQDATTGQAHAMLASIYYEGDPCAPGQSSEYHQLWEDHREQAEQLIGDTAAYYLLQARATPDVQKALTLLAQALELDRQHYDSLRERAHIYQAQRDYYEMATDAACMITVQPRNPQGYDLMAVALREMERFDEALENHKNAIALSPDDPDLYDGRRETYMQMQRYDLALQDALKCADLRSNEPAYLFKPFAVLTAEGDYDQATECYAQFTSSPLASRGYDPDNLINNVGMWFHWFSARQILESLQSGQSWHGSELPPHTAPYTIVHEGDATCRQWSNNARCIVYTGFEPSWSPDGTKLVYSQGLHTASVVAVLNLETGRTNLLISPGRAPQWSPDGKYIAFVKDRWLLPPSKLDHLHCLDWILEGQQPGHAEEVWLIDLDSRRTRRIGAGANPQWGQRSHRLYYCGAANGPLYSVSVEDPNDESTPVLTHCDSPIPRISPDERFVADSLCRELRIIDLATNEIVATWMVPAGCRDALNVQWSPDGDELSIGGFISNMGLWIYSLKSHNATKILRGPGASACWAPDRRQLAACLGPPFFAIWLAELTADRPTAGSFEPVRTPREHNHSLIEKFTREIKADPGLIYAYHQRADCALWTGDEKAAEYLHEFDRVLSVCDASGCASHARRILDWPREQRDRLLPLALMLARKAVTEEPDNREYQDVLEKALELHP